MATTADDTSRLRLPGLLLVEPDPGARAHLTRALGQHGWQVWSTADPQAAVDTYLSAQDRIDVALVDLQLPGLQGVRVLAELDQINPGLVRCAMSADVTPYTASAFRRLSATPLFAKPLDPAALASALYEMVASTRVQAPQGTTP